MLNTDISIYKLECIENGRVYIGKTKDPKARKQCHFSALKRGKHHVPLMQEDFDKYGESAFVFTVLEVIKRRSVFAKNGGYRFEDEIKEKETMLRYKSYLPEYGYNYNDKHFRPTWGPHRKYKHRDDWISKNKQRHEGREKETA